MYRTKPAYLRIADVLRGRIERQELVADDRLPPERELVEEFNVARMTVRHALDVLQHEGLIDRRRGRTGGTFVRTIPPVLQLSSLNSVVAQLDSRGHAVDSTVIDVKIEKITRPVAAHLELDEYELVWVIRRCRETDGVPLMFSIHYLPFEPFPDLESRDLTKPIHDLLHEHYNSGPVCKRELVTPVLAGEVEQKYLKVDEHHPLLRLARTERNHEGNVICFTDEVLRADLASVEVVVGIDPNDNDEA